jgi:CRISPR-associated endonuclease/helicase Cas3
MLTVDAVKRHIRENGATRVIIVCNTVERAIRLKRELKASGIEVELVIHSRHLPKDREAKLEIVQKLFGKDALGSIEGEGRLRCRVVIATQVIEVGLDISCDLLLTELAPVDALIQRAGRCARWAEVPGKVVVFDLPEGLFAPYDSELCQATKQALAARTGEVVLTWEMEQELIDEVLDRTYLEALEPERGGYAVSQLARAVFLGDRRAAEKAIRESDSAEVSLCQQPDLFQGRLRLVPAVPVSVGILKRFVKKNPGSLLRLDETGQDERLTPVQSPLDVVPFARYIATNGMSYSGGLDGEGLVVQIDDNSVLSGVGDWQPELRKWERGRWRTDRIETVRYHTFAALEHLRRIVKERERYGWNLLQKISGYHASEIKALVEGAVVVHDLGKLTIRWQEVARKTLDLWWQTVCKDSGIMIPSEMRRTILDALEGRIFLARFPDLPEGHAAPALPTHATVGPYLAWDYFEHRWGKFGVAALLAAAHHHSVRTTEVPAFEMKEGWRQEIEGLGEVASDLVKVIVQESQRSSTELPKRMPAFHDGRCYTFYVIVARCLSLADRIAAGGGEDAIRNYEEWFYSI